MSDSYRPGSRYDEPPGYDRYRSGPSRPPPDMYHFRGQAERLQQNRPRRDVRFPSLPSNGPRYNDFDFRSDMQGPRGDRGRDFFERPSNGIPTGPRRGGQATRGGFRGGSRQRGASDRVILRSKRATTPERLNGMQEGQASFKALEDLSDSEAEMDLASDAENKSSAEPDGDTDGQPAAKRSRNDHEMMADSVPKWSNPDPYTSLPPPDESQAKKKDVVRLIRKAKVSVEHDQHASNLAADNADFISFNFDDDNMSHRSGSISESDRSSPGPGVRRTKGDQKFSHLDNLHPARTVSPPRPLAERIELPAKPQQASSTANRPSAAGPLPPRLPPQPRGTVNIDTWPPPDTRAAIAKSIGDPSSLLAQPVPQTSGAKQGKKRKRDDITGGVTYAWTPKLNEDATPWCRADHSLTESMGVWLHKEVRDFYDYVKPHEFERTVREDLISRVAKVMSRRYPGGQVYSFGSFAAGIYLPTADMDLVFVSNQYLRGGYPVYASSISWMRKLKTYLEEEGLAHSGAEVVWSAKVPIIKFTDKLSNIRVDVSFENMTGVTANATFQAWKAQFPVMPTIVTLIKQFLLMRGLNEVFTGGVGGFAVTCLVVSMLQHLPAVQSNNMVPEQNLGEMLLNFLDLYGKRFNVNTTAISMAPPGYFPKMMNGAKSKPDRICILDPNNNDNDISGGSAKVMLIMQEFAKAHSALLNQMAYLERQSLANRKGASILGSVFAGDYKSFGYQRSHLRQMFERRFLDDQAQAYAEHDSGLNVRGIVDQPQMNAPSTGPNPCGYPPPAPTGVGMDSSASMAGCSTNAVHARPIAAMKKTPIELARERHAAKRVVEEKEKQMTSRKVPQPATHEHWRVGFSTSSSGYRHPVFARYSGVGDHAQDSTHNVTELTISTPITSFTPINQPAQATGDSLEDAIVID